MFFEKDALNWFKVNDDKIDFVPTYKVRVVMKEEHNKKLESTVDELEMGLGMQENTSFNPLKSFLSDLL